MNWKLARSQLSWKIPGILFSWGIAYGAYTRIPPEAFSRDAQVMMAATTIAAYGLLVIGGLFAISAFPALWWMSSGFFRYAASAVLVPLLAGTRSTIKATGTFANDIAIGLGDLLDGIAGAIAGLFSMIGRLLRHVIELIRAAALVIGNTLHFLQKPIANLMRGIAAFLNGTGGWIGLGLAGLGHILAQILRPFARLVGLMLRLIGRGFTTLWHALAAVAAGVGGFLAWITTPVSPRNLGRATGVVFRLVARLLAQIAAILALPIVGIGRVLKTIFSSAATLISPVTAAITTGFLLLIRALAAPIRLLKSAAQVGGRGVVGFGRLLGASLAPMAQLLRQLGGLLAKLLTGTVHGLGAIMNLLAYPFVLIINGMGAGLLIIGHALGTILRGLAHLIGQATNLVARGLLAVVRALGAIFTAIWRGLVYGARMIGAGARPIGHVLNAVLRGLATVIWQGIRFIGRGLQVIGRAFAAIFKEIWRGLGHGARLIGAGISAIAFVFRLIVAPLVGLICWIIRNVSSGLMVLSGGISKMGASVGRRLSPSTEKLGRLIMNKDTFFKLAGSIVLAVGVVWGVSRCKNQQASGGDPITNANPRSFRIVAESEVKTLQDAGLFDQFTKETNIHLTINYRGPIDIRNAVAKISKENPKTVDAYWPGSSLWLSGSSTVSPETVMKTYVVLAVEPDVTNELGWDTAKGISAADLVDGIQSGKIKLAMTSASQSTPGAVFFLAMYTALSGKPVLTSADLNNPETLDSLVKMLEGVERSAQSIDHLKDVFVEDKVSGTNQTNAIVIYESLAIEINQELVAKGQKPLTVFYVDGATAIADVPIRYVDNGDDKKLDQYQKLVEFLTRPDIREKIQSLGWRTNPIGMALDDPDLSLFNPAWGINAATEFQEMIFPKPPATKAALDWYQANGRKPSYTVYCLDYSGSMRDNGGRTQMIDAMDLLLNQERAATVSLQATANDLTIVYGFADAAQQIGSQVAGDDTDGLNTLSQQIASYGLSGSTAMFSCIETALGYISKNYDPDKYAYSVIAMTDGGSNKGATPAEFLTYYQNLKLNIPVYGIAFGSPDFNQLNELAKTGGAVYDGRLDIAAAFRAAKGNN